MSKQSAGKVIVITGKTASGKDTVISRILTSYPNLKRIVTVTSRKIRTGEANGVDYYFITEGEFKQKINKGDFAEYVEYGGNLYGTYKAELKQALTQDTLWKIDPSRAGEVRNFIKRAFPKDLATQFIKAVLVIYITAPDEVVLQRLKERNLSQDEIEKRMADDKKIWDQYKDNYDFVVENVPGKLNEAIKKINQIIER